jgi:hypothetical protein
MTDNLKATIREAGGIVHGDGNIFFTNAEQFLAAAREAVAGAIDARGQEASPGFNTKYPLLNDLLQETWWLGKGPNNMDTGLAWFESLELYLASREQSPASPDAGAGVAQCPNCKGTRTPHALDPARRGRCECVEGAPASAPEAPPSALLSDTDLARIHRRVTGANRFDQSALELMREVEHAVNEKRAPEAPEQQGEAVAAPRAAFNAVYEEQCGRPITIRTIAWRCFQAGAALAQAAPATGKVVEMVLHCPKCGLQHVDAPETREVFHGDSGPVEVADWANPPHRSHLCHGCGHIWRPADVPTNGVQAVKTTGNADSPIATPAPTVQAETGEAITDAASDVLSERARQIGAEGWTPAHNDQYKHGDLASAAACYATRGRYHYPTSGKPGPTWPWPPEWWKPTTYRRNLVKAGALILAEIERIDRAALTAVQADKGGV